MKVMPGDYIVAVNGISRDALEMVRLLRDEARVEVKIQKPKSWVVTLRKAVEKTPLGMRLGYGPASKSLVVLDLADGLVQRWNSDHPGSEVRLHDRVVTVNGRLGAPADMLHAVRESRELVLQFSRPKTMAL